MNEKPLPIIYDKTEQGHGHAFENMIKAGFPGSSNSKRSPTQKFDIEGKYDKHQNLPTSVKCTTGKSICLADANNTFSIDEPFRLVAIQVKQNDNLKEVKAIREYIITPDKWKEIKGEMPIAEVNNFHQALKSFPEGEHEEARKFAKNKKAELTNSYSSSIALNPKIDSKNQRRLQASIKLEVLDKHVQPTIIEAENGSAMYRNISVGKIESPPRNLKPHKIEK